MKPPREKELLLALIPAISEIDGGCGVCELKFVTTANEALAAIGSQYRYEFIDYDNRLYDEDGNSLPGFEYDVRLIDAV